MKMKLSLKILAVAVATILFAAILPTARFTAHAGSSKVYLASSAAVTDGRINTGTFYVNGGVSGSGDSAVFPEQTGGKDVSLVAKTRIDNMISYGVADMIKSSLTVKIDELRTGGKASFSYGLSSLSKRAGAADSFELAFACETEGVISLFVREYLKDGGEIVNRIGDGERSLVSFGSEFNLTMNVTVNADVTVSIDGEELWSRRLNVNPEGYMAIASFGGVSFSVKDFDVYGYKYEAPTTLDIEENFDNGEYNANLLYSKATSGALAPAYLKVVDGRLKFKNTNFGYLSTLYQYSNFEMSFDLVDLRRDPGVDEEGNTVGISSFFAVAFGEPEIDCSIDTVVNFSSWLYFEGMPVEADHSQYPPNSGRYVLMENRVSRSANVPFDEFKIWNSEFIDGRTVRIRFALIDGLVSVYMRFIGDIRPGEEQYYEDACYFEYDLGQSKKGYVKLLAYGPFGAECNLTIDNFSVKNKDSEVAKSVAPSPVYKSPKKDPTPDFDYKDVADPNDLLSKKIENGDQKSIGGGCGSSISTGEIILSAVVAAVAVSAIVFRRKKNEK